MTGFEKGRDFDIEWAGHFYKVDPTFGTLSLLRVYDNQLESIGQFQARFRKETFGAYDDPAAFARRFHRDNPMATADNVRLAASMGMISEYVRYGEPIEELYRYAANITATLVDPNQLVLKFS